jgi:hypothetical protein
MEMAIEIAVGQTTGVGKCGKAHAFCVSDQTRADRKTSALVEDAVESFIGVGPCGFQKRYLREVC